MGKQGLVNGKMENYLNGMIINKKFKKKTLIFLIWKICEIHIYILIIIIMNVNNIGDWVLESF